MPSRWAKSGDKGGSQFGVVNSVVFSNRMEGLPRVADVDHEVAMRMKRIRDVEFCRKCLEIIDEVHRTKKPIIITRDLVMLVPAGDWPSASKQSRSRKANGAREESRSLDSD